ncbi:TRAP transporter small permease [Mailhella massiliensis]|uniref:TRAP transporter small permease n=1 Tax=Mailhella massiliensis TaxID=1903261 RepID=A0A921DQT7_9BACT|nr:TRAP transporter small permease [Mailhella massiliensis]HJD96890.1 TRAP transporter small permease [Mailhella massiliensis]
MWSFLNARFEELLGALLLAVMACISFINVIVRYCTNFSFSSSEELTVNFFVWIVLLGTARAFREGGNFSMNLLYDAMPRPVRKLLYVFSILCSIVFFAALCWQGSVEVMDEIELNVVSESLAIPVWLYTIATPLFSALIIVRILQKVWEDFRARNY